VQNSGQPIGLLVQLAAGRSVEPLERLYLHSPALLLPGACHGTVDQERRRRLRRLGIEDSRAVLLWQDLRSPRVREERRVPDREETHRGRHQVLDPFIGRRVRGTEPVLSRRIQVRAATLPCA
jgi:hypothetical protein